MEGQRFDQLSRRMARFGSRREVLKGLAGAVAATLVGGRAGASAQPACTPHYTACSGDGECCAGAVCQWGLCMPGCRIGGAFHNAWTPEPGNPCARCAPEVSTTGWSPANGGMACWGGSTSLCGSGPSTCQNGACVAGAQISCQPLTVCHEAGVCDPTTGLCSHPPAAVGKVCGGTESCLNGMHYPPLTCDGNGFCVGNPAVPCAPYGCGSDRRCRTSCTGDEQCGTGAVCRQNECLSLREDGASCPEDHHCRSGHCVEGICCDTACASLCELCGTGTCQPKNCSDNLNCTVDTCDESTGQCVHTQATTSCLIDGACYEAEQPHSTDTCLVCNPALSQDGWSLLYSGCCETNLDCENGAACISGSCVQRVGGELTSATPTGRCGPQGAVNFARDLYQIAHGGGPLQIGVRGESSGEGSLADPLVLLHTTFNPADVCANLVAIDDDGGCDWDPLITLSDLAAGEYTVVIGGFAGSLGTYRLTFGLGPGC